MSYLDNELATATAALAAENDPLGKDKIFYDFWEKAISERDKKLAKDPGDRDKIVGHFKDVIQRAWQEYIASLAGRVGVAAVGAEQQAQIEGRLELQNQNLSERLAALTRLYEGAALRRALLAQRSLLNPSDAKQAFEIDRQLATLQ